MNKICTVLFLGILPFLSFSQTEELDSLKQAVEKTAVDSNLVYGLIRLTIETRHDNVKEALVYARKAKKLASQIKWEKGEMKASYMSAICSYVISDYNKAFNYLDTAIILASKLEDIYQLGIAYDLKGSIYRELGDNTKALIVYQKSLEVKKNAGLEDGIGYSYNNIGTTFFDIGNNTEARKFFLKGLPIAEANKDSNLLIHLYSNLGTVSEKTEKRDYYLKAISVAKQTNRLYSLISPYGNLAYYYATKDSFALAISYRLKAMQLAKEKGSDYTYAQTAANLGYEYLSVNKIDSAQYYLQKSKVLSKKIGAKEVLKGVYEGLAELYEKKGLYKKAYENMKLYNVLADTLFDESTAEKNAEFSTRFEMGEKEKELTQKNLELASKSLEIVKHKSLQNKFLAIGLGLLLLGGLLFQWYSNKQKHKKKEAALALKLSEAEANKLRELDQLKSRFFTNISHELRTPLTLITGPLQEVLENKDVKSAEKDIKLAHSNSKKLLNLINEILDLSKLENDKMEVTATNFELEPWLRRVFFAFESLAETQEISLAFESTLPKETAIKADAGKMEKILNNLLSNGIKYNQPNGKIKLSTTIIGDELQIKVCDTGNGLSPEELPRIFKRFYQVSDENAPLLGGTGVGLALAKELAKLMGGDITVESELGKGSTFLLSIPFEKGVLKGARKGYDEKETLVTKKVAVYESLLINGEKPQILIVEDNPEMSQYLKSILSENHRCELANNGKEALGKVSKKNYDLIISDVMMPIMDGFEFKKKFNELQGIQYTPFIMLTARALQEDRLIGFKLGVDDYITKPFDKMELVARVHNLLQNKIEREAWQKNEGIQEEPALSVEESLLRQAEGIVLNNLDNSSFKVTNLASEMAYSQRQLTRLIKKMTGMTPVGFILELKLQKAYQLIKNKQFHSVTEVMYEVGIESLSYFSTKFTERFGCNPREL